MTSPVSELDWPSTVMTKYHWNVKGDCFGQAISFCHVCDHPLLNSLTMLFYEYLRSIPLVTLLLPRRIIPSLKCLAAGLECYDSFPTRYTEQVN